MATQPGENRTLLAPVPLTQAQVADTLAQSAVYQFAARARTAYTWEQVYAQHLAPLLANLPPRKDIP